MALLRSHVVVRDFALVAPAIRVVRTGPAEFNFSDLVAGTGEPAPEPAPVPSRWTVTVERLSLSRGRITVDDRAVAPPTEWLVQDLDVEVKSLTTAAGAVPGGLSLRAKINEAVLVVSIDPMRLAPHQYRATLSLDGFETRRLIPYVYASTPYQPQGGRLSIALASTLDSDAEEIRKAVLSGTLTLQGEAFAKVGRQDPFVSASRVAVEIEEADALEHTLTIRQLTIDGLDLKARRDVRGVIDLIEMFTPKASPTAPAAGAPPPVRLPAPGRTADLVPGDPGARQRLRANPRRADRADAEHGPLHRRGSQADDDARPREAPGKSSTTSRGR